MSRENVDLVREGFRRFQAGDPEWAEIADPDIEWDISAHPLPDVPNVGRGRDELLSHVLVPHHESAIEMAEVAQRLAKHPQIKHLADEIIDAQRSEIDLLRVDHERIFGEPLTGMSAEHGDLGLPPHEAGMETDMAGLEEARQFDFAFIDMMIPHHQGAIRMARIEVAQGEDDELADVNTAIIEGQSHEIEE